MQLGNMSVLNDSMNKTIRSEFIQMMEKLNEERKKAGKMIVGGTHFKRERERTRSSNYTLSKIIKECVDNVCYKCNNLNITYALSPEGYLKKLSISDDYTFGFEDIKKEGISNPFNFTHMREGHSSDLETSQFGIGFKSAAASSCEILKIYTQVEGKFYLVICDFIKMEAEPIPAFSFDPEIYEIAESEYRRDHHYETGSTIIFEDINKKIHNKTNSDAIYSDILNSLSECYSDVIKTTGFNIYINDKPVPPEIDYSNHPQCVPFTIQGKFIRYLDKHDSTCEAYVYHDHLNDYNIFNNSTKNWNKMKTIYWILIIINL